jgi:hypothetical protein
MIIYLIKLKGFTVGQLIVGSMGSVVIFSPRVRLRQEER